MSTPSLEIVAVDLAAPPGAADERYFHEDLPWLTDGELRLERHRLRLAVLFWERPASWTLERLKRIEAELEGRHAR